MKKFITQAMLIGTNVQYIGHGQEHLTARVQLEKLVDAMKKNVLDPSFEAYGDFVYQLTSVKKSNADEWFIFGNFFDRSLVFRIDTTNAELVKLFKQLVFENKQTDAYKQAKVARQQQETEQRSSYGLEAI